MAFEPLPRNEKSKKTRHNQCSMKPGDLGTLPVWMLGISLAASKFYIIRLIYFPRFESGIASRTILVEQFCVVEACKKRVTFERKSTTSEARVGRSSRGIAQNGRLELLFGSNPLPSVSTTLKANRHHPR